MKESLQKILNEQWLNKLPSKEVLHEKLLIGFSDIPGSGLTYDLARDIADRYEGVLIPKDAARTLIYQNEKIENTQQVEDILDEYMDDALNLLTKIPNGLLIIDAGVDRKFEFYRNWAKLNGYEIFIIGFVVTKDEVVNRVYKDRDKQTAEWFVNQLDRWYRDQEKFNQTVGANFYIKDHNEDQIEELYRELDKVIK